MSGVARDNATTISERLGEPGALGELGSGGFVVGLVMGDLRKNPHLLSAYWYLHRPVALLYTPVAHA